MSRRTTGLALATLLGVDVLLIAMAMHPSPAASGGGLTAPPATSATRSTPRPSGTAGTGAAVPLQTAVVGIDATHAWRAVVGSCASGGGLVQTTSDGGRTWTKGTSPGRVVLRVQPMGGGRGFVVAADGACVPGERITRDEARTWEAARSALGGWSRDARDTRVVITPQQPASRPCGDEPVLDLNRSSATQAHALCRGGTVRTTADGGASWQVGSEVPGALALSTRTEQGTVVAYVARYGSGCAGVEVVRARPRGTAPERVACVPAGPAQPGRVSLSVGTAGWLLAGAQVWRSDGGLTSFARVDEA